MIHSCIIGRLLLLSAAFASPLAYPQAVTEAISPSALPLPGCSGSYSGIFGIAVVNVTDPTPVKRQVNGIITTTSLTVPLVSQIADGQIQAPPTAVTVTTVICGSPTSRDPMYTSTMMPVVQIGDGQIQNPVTTSVSTGAHVETAASDSDEGDLSALSPFSQSQIEPSSSNSLSTLQTQPSPTTLPQSTFTSTSTSMASTPTNPDSSRTALVSCRTNSTLTLTLSNSILLDAHNRTGYIASNTQFQFDGPPQSGSIYTAGWSVCDSDEYGSLLALGGNNVFYQCLSGQFYNLYTENWAPQCQEVRIGVVEIIDC